MRAKIFCAFLRISLYNKAAEKLFRTAGNGEKGMSMNMKRITGRAILALLLAAAIGAVLALGADAASSARKRARLKNAPPPGWQFEVGYTLWRAQRGLDATPQTWKKYQRERKRLAQRGKLRGLDTRLLNSVDWTLEELAEFLEVQQEQMRADN